MERKGVKEPDAPRKLADTFNEVFPYYLASGMPSEEFWKGNPDRVVAYRKKLQIENQRRNEVAWLQGRYIYEAVSVALHNKFRNKGDNPLEYPTEPHRITPQTKAEKEAERKQYIEGVRNMLEGLKASHDARSNNGTT